MIFQLGIFMPNWGCWILKAFKFHRYINFVQWSTLKNLYRFSHLTYTLFSGFFFWHAYIVAQFYPIVFCLEPFGTWAIVFWYCLVGEPLLVIKYHKTEFICISFHLIVGELCGRNFLRILEMMRLHQQYNHV